MAIPFIFYYLISGDLIDIVKRRGPRALNVLVEFIEYEYPDMFKTIMRRMAREPDPKGKTKKLSSRCFSL